MSREGNNEAQEPNSSPWLNLVRRKVSSLRFGTVLITVHDGEVVQVDATERTRFARTRNDAGDRAGEREPA